MKVNVAAPLLDYDGQTVPYPIAPTQPGQPMTTRPTELRDIIARAIDAAVNDAAAEEKFRMGQIGIELFVKNEIDLDTYSWDMVLDACSRPPCQPIAYTRIRLAVEEARAKEARDAIDVEVDVEVPASNGAVVETAAS